MSQEKQNKSQTTEKKTNATADQPQPVKRRPGRPPDPKNKKDVQKKNGIVASPSSDQNILEMRYADPIIFKSLWSHFKHMDIESLQHIFRKGEIIIYGKDHTAHSHIYARINANHVNHYFCKDEFDIGVALKVMMPYMNTIDKKETMHIDIASRYSEYKNNIRIYFGTAIGALECHKINVMSGYDSLTREKEREFLDVGSYKIRFRLPPKYFKKKMNDVSLCKTTTIDFIQDGKGKPLTIEYEAENKCASSKIPFKLSDKINFESDIAEGESFRITTYLEDLKSISSVGFTNDVDIYMDEDKSILFKTKLDDAIELRILTKTIKDKCEVSGG
jgi:hypothetical protein